MYKSIYMVAIKFVFEFFYYLHKVTPFLFTVVPKHPKTASNLLKPMEQSNMITQELETTEMSRIS